jgi:hypothetical protein
MYAILVAVPAIPLKPKTAAIKAITKNVSAQLNMLHHPFSKTVSGWPHRVSCGTDLRLELQLSLLKHCRKRCAENDILMKHSETRKERPLQALLAHLAGVPSPAWSLTDQGDRVDPKAADFLAIRPAVRLLHSFGHRVVV